MAVYFLTSILKYFKQIEIVDVAYDGVDGLKKIEESSFDVAILD